MGIFAPIQRGLTAGTAVVCPTPDRARLRLSNDREAHMALSPEDISRKRKLIQVLLTEITASIAKIEARGMDMQRQFIKLDDLSRGLDLAFDPLEDRFSPGKSSLKPSHI